MEYTGDRSGRRRVDARRDRAGAADDARARRSSTAGWCARRTRSTRMMMSVAALGFVGVAWALARLLARVRAGHRRSSATSRARSCAASGLEPQGTIPHLLFMAYQGTFAIITAALISGAIVERMRFRPYLAFITLWSLVVYAPGRALGLGRRLPGQAGRARLRGRHRRAHQRRRGRAGGGARARAAQGLRAPGDPAPQRCRSRCSAPGLLWFGWFGFNAGSALAANALASLAFVNTMLAPAGDARGLDAARPRAQRQGDRGRARRPAIVVGLVAITPAAGFVVAARRRSRSARSRRSRATSRCCWRARTRPRRLARRGGGARRRRHGGRAAHRRVRHARPGTARSTACSTATPASSASRRSPCWRRSRTAASRRFVLLKLVGPRDAAARSRRSEEGLGLDVSQHGEEAYARRRGRDPGPAATARRQRCRRPALTAAAAEGGRA